MAGEGVKSEGGVALHVGTGAPQAACEEGPCMWDKG